MVPPPSHRIPRVPWYSGYQPLNTTSFTGLSPSVAAAFHLHSPRCIFDYVGPYPDPYCYKSVWALPLSLATTYGITCCFLFLRVLRCFSSPRVPHVSYVFTYMYICFYHMWVSPFGYPCFIGYLHLHTAFRSLSRPSSAPSARASSLRS